MPLTVLDTIYGPLAIDATSVEFIGTVFEKKKRGLSEKPQRMLGTRGGHKIYIIDSRKNLTALLGAETAEQFAPKPEKVKRTTRKANATLSGAGAAMVGQG